MTDLELDRCRKTIDYARRHHLVPGGSFIETSNSASGPMTIRLVSSVHPNAARKLAASLPPVSVPQRLQQPHPVIARLRDDDQRLSMPPELRHRSLLLLQAIAEVAADRGWKVTAPPAEHHGFRNSYYQHTKPFREGQIQIKIDDFAYTVTIDQEFPQSSNPVKFKTLKISLPHYQAHGSRCDWADRKTMKLEDRLAEIVDTLANRAISDRESVKAEENEKAERQQRWDAAVTQAKEEALQHHYAGTLHRQARMLEECRMLNEYCSHLEQRITAADPDAPELESAKAWLEWARAYTEDIDPFRTLPTMPAAPEFSADDLKPFLSGMHPHRSEANSRPHRP